MFRGHGRTFGLKGVFAAGVCSIALFAPASAGAATITNPATITVPEAFDGPADVYPSVINAPGLPAGVATVGVTLHSINHPGPSGMDVLLVAPNSANVVLMSGRCSAMAGTTLTFYDGYPVLTDDGPCPSGAYRPTEGPPTPSFPAATMPNPSPPVSPYGTTLAPLAGNSSGTWRLYVRNSNGGPGGTIAGWTLRLDEPVPAGASEVASALPPIAAAIGSNRRCAGLPATIISKKTVVTGTPGSDVILSLNRKKSRVTGLEGDDIICGGDGRNKTLSGGAGNDRLFGQGGRDSLLGGEGADRLSGGPDEDFCNDAKGSEIVDCEHHPAFFKARRR